MPDRQRPVLVGELPIVGLHELVARHLRECTHDALVERAPVQVRGGVADVLLDFAEQCHALGLVSVGRRATEAVAASRSSAASSLRELVPTSFMCRVYAAPTGQPTAQAATGGAASSRPARVIGESADRSFARYQLRCAPLDRRLDVRGGERLPGLVVEPLRCERA